MDRARVKTTQQQPGDRGGDLLLHWVDSFSVALLKQRSDARGAWGELLASYRWQVYAILTFAPARSSCNNSRPSFAGAQRAVARWFEELQHSYPRITAFTSYDHGKANGRLNVHVLLGGLFLHKPPPPGLHHTLHITRAIGLARRAWTSGLVKKCEPFDPQRGAPSYVAQYCNDTDLIPEFFGEPIKKKHRRRRHHHAQPQ